ncbi:MAG: tRNA lysidine(34) synthetase TilS [Clostridia bacterium]|nr:tRNA lysidine(34) synthetase TilS [Clostridia bacterium]
MAFKALGLEKDYTSAHLDAVFALQYAERGARLDLPKKIRAEKLLHAVCIYLSKEEEYAPLGEEKPFEIGVFNGGRYEVTVSKEEPTPQEDGWKTLRFDEEKLPKSAIFRFRREGDKIKAFSGDTKSLKKLFNEKKIPVRERGYIPLLAEKDGETVYAVCGVEISEKIKVDENTKNVVYISIRKRGKV